MPPMHLPSVIKELLELAGPQQWRLAKKLGVAQGTISKWLSGTQQPTKPQWDRIERLYFELKGWRFSLDEKIAPYDEATQQRIHDVVDSILQMLPATTKR